MQDVFITKIHIDKVQHLQGVDIRLSDSERRSLILTGKNGSGKTSLLEAMRDSVIYAQQGIESDEMRVTRSARSKKPDIDISYSQKSITFRTLSLPTSLPGGASR